MTDAAAPAESLPPTGSIGRARVRLVVLTFLCVCWILPWPERQLEVTPGGARVEAFLTGAERTGAIGGLSLLVIWGLAATALGARTHRGLRFGAALTEAGVALGATTLLLLEHPWIPGGDVREAWGAVFGPLTLLALLEAGTLWFGGRSHRTVAVIRAVAAAFAAGCFAVSLAWVPAGIAAWLALSPLLFLKVRSVRGGRRGLDVLLVLAAVLHGFSFHLHEQFVGAGHAIGSTLNLPFAAWGVLTAIVTVTALDGLLSRDDAA